MAIKLWLITRDITFYLLVSSPNFLVGILEAFVSLFEIAAQKLKGNF
jgi:hypothetical protein